MHTSIYLKALGDVIYWLGWITTFKEFANDNGREIIAKGTKECSELNKKNWKYRSIYAH